MMVRSTLLVVALTLAACVPPAATASRKPILQNPAPGELWEVVVRGDESRRTIIEVTAWDRPFLEGEVRGESREISPKQWTAMTPERSSIRVDVTGLASLVLHDPSLSPNESEELRAQRRREAFFLLEMFAISAGMLAGG